MKHCHPSEVYPVGRSSQRHDEKVRPAKPAIRGGLQRSLTPWAKDRERLGGSNRGVDTRKPCFLSKRGLTFRKPKQDPKTRIQEGSVIPIVKKPNSRAPEVMTFPNHTPQAVASANTETPPSCTCIHESCCPSCSVSRRHGMEKPRPLRSPGVSRE